MKIKTLIKGSFAVSIGTFIGGAISYLFSVAMGRLLGPAKFGDLGAISSFLIIVTSVSGAVSTVAMHYSGQLLAGEKKDELKRLHRRLSRLVFGGSLILMLVSMLSVGWIVRTFSISDSKALYIVLITVVPSFLVVINKGILQGTQRFWGTTVSNIIELLVKLAIGVVLVKLGLSLIGATIAMVTASIVSYLVTYYLIRDLVGGKSTTSDNTTEPEDLLERRDVLGYFWPTVGSTVLLLALMNLDTVFIKHFFAPDQAGQYIAVATIAKIIFFITGPISLVMFPLITEQKAKGEKHYHTLAYSILLTLLASFFLLAIYTVFKDKIVTTLYGSAYSQLGGLLPLASWLVIFLSLVNLMTQYFMSIRQFVFVYFFLPVIIALGYRIYLFHSSITEVLNSLIAGAALLFTLMMIYYLLTKRLQIRSFYSQRTNARTT